MTEINVRHNEADERFECEVEGGKAFAEYIIDGDEITFTHTEVPPQAEGKGIAGKIVSQALEFARRKKFRVVPQCPYVATYVKRHREYDDLLHPEYRE